MAANPHGAHQVGSSFRRPRGRKAAAIFAGVPWKRTSRHACFAAFFAKQRPSKFLSVDLVEMAQGHVQQRSRCVVGLKALTCLSFFLTHLSSCTYPEAR